MRILSSLCLLLVSCRLYLTSEELPVQAALQQETQKAPTLIEFYIEPGSQSLFTPGDIQLRIIRLDENGRGDGAEKIDAVQGHKMLLLEPGIWQILEVCKRPCKGYVVRQKRLPAFQIKPARVNYMGTFVLDLTGEEPSYDIEFFIDAAQSALAASWPTIGYPLQKAE
jgi:hypothetical protein